MGQACGHSLLCRSQQYRTPAAAELRGQQVFLRADVAPAAVLPSLQDALLQLASVVDVSSLQTTIKDVLRVVLPNVECVFVYLLEAESRLRCEDPPHEVPSEGKLRDAVKQQKRLQCSTRDLISLCGVKAQRQCDNERRFKE
ncbi:cGMP-dependent 3',5'-cyclic phosphodiesterase-like [Sinocyclocheilus anshuiensis]|uniref:cGMP-dependent 3',5'-cyclic phosphodiesterase-like n=1 Tax=Sinocyclocheilus anshuiensis TaxID=1608454 RepID=UPI0007B7F05E|nr:PREDICTED: cGMP-dependent 3',5'-cyclic phosphodiesterase-like [Sinocyclocheilus anshuiensis]